MPTKRARKRPKIAKDTEKKEVKRVREKKTKPIKPISTWRPPPFDFAYEDTWCYEVSFNKQRMTIEGDAEVTPPPLEPIHSSPSASGGNKRRRKPVAAPNPMICVKRHAKLLIPSFLTRSLWQRHGYTLADILYTLQCFKPFHLWHLAISERLSLTKLAVQPSYAARDSFVFGAKAIVIDHLRNWISQTYTPPNGESCHVLTNMEGSHVPPLPVHRLSDSEFEEYVQKLPAEGGNGLEIAIYSFPSPPIWRDIQVLPVEMERGQFLLMSRVMPIQEYLDQFGVPECLTMTPIRVQMSDGSKYCIFDESWHFIAASNPSSSQPLPDSS